MSCGSRGLSLLWQVSWPVLKSTVASVSAGSARYFFVGAPKSPVPDGLVYSLLLQEDNCFETPGVSRLDTVYKLLLYVLQYHLSLLDSAWLSKQIFSGWELLSCSYRKIMSTKNKSIIFPSSFQQWIYYFKQVLYVPSTETAQISHQMVLATLLDLSECHPPFAKITFPSASASTKPIWSEGKLLAAPRGI